MSFYIKCYIYLMNDLQRAFIHEVGHFVAAELNFRLFNYDRRIDEFVIHLRNNSSNLYDGYVTTNKTPNSNQIDHNIIVNYYTNIAYGCVFESLYRKDRLNKCLCDVSIKDNLQFNFGNGQNDYHELNRLRIIRLLSRSVFEECEKYLFEEYFENMIELRDNKHFDRVFNLDVEDFILNSHSQRRFIIDIEKLSESLNEFLELHQPYFLNLVNNLCSIQGLEHNN